MLANTERNLFGIQPSFPGNHNTLGRFSRALERLNRLKTNDIALPVLICEISPLPPLNCRSCFSAVGPKPAVLGSLWGPFPPCGWLTQLIPRYCGKIVGTYSKNASQRVPAPLECFAFQSRYCWSLSWNGCSGQEQSSVQVTCLTDAQARISAVSLVTYASNKRRPG